MSKPNVTPLQLSTAKVIDDATLRSNPELKQGLENFKQPKSNVLTEIRDLFLSVVKGQKAATEAATVTQDSRPAPKIQPTAKASVSVQDVFNELKGTTLQKTLEAVRKSSTSTVEKSGSSHAEKVVASKANGKGMGIGE